MGLIWHTNCLQSMRIFLISVKELTEFIHTWKGEVFQTINKNIFWI